MFDPDKKLLDSVNTGVVGRQRVDASGSAQTVSGKFIGVKAVNGNCSYGPGCEAEEGDAPSEDDVVLQGDLDIWPATAIEIKTGVAFVYKYTD